MKRVSPLSVLCSVASLLLVASTSHAAVYVVGDSYSSTGGGGPIPGDVRVTNGSVWIENLADRLHQPMPVTSSAIPSSPAETPTNFARGGARAIANDGTGGVTRPKDGSEQLDEIRAYLAANSLKVKRKDIFALWLGGNDVIEPYLVNTPEIVTVSYINAVVDEIEYLVASAIDLGFRIVVMPNAVATERLPLHLGLPTPEIKIMFGEDAAYLNTLLEKRIAVLQADHPEVVFITADWNSLFRLAAHEPEDYGFADSTGMISTGADPATAMWFDAIHPSAKMHLLMADAVSGKNRRCSSERRD